MSKLYGAVVGWLIRHKRNKRYPVYVGIDPGASGAIAFVNATGYKVFDIPVIKVEVKGGGKRKNRTDYHLKRIVALFAGLQGFRGNVRAAVEVTQPQTSGFKGRHFAGKGGRGTFGKSAYNAYRSGMSYYMWPLALMVKGFVVRQVHPITWKSKLKLRGKTKGRSLKLARELFPDAELHLKKHHGRAEALLIAYWLRTVTEEET